MASTTFVNGVTLTDAGWFNDVNDLVYDLLGDTTNAPSTRQAARDNLFTAGTTTTSVPVVNVTQTWNAGGVTFTANKTNVTDTASAAGSLLADWQVGGTSKISITKSGAVQVSDGTVGAPGVTFGSDPDNGAYRIGTNNWALSCAGAKVMEFNPGGEITMPLQPAFSAYNTTTRTNKTGNGSQQVVDMDGEIFDQGSDYNAGTSVFTAPVDGKYRLSARVLVVSLSASANDMIILLTTSNRTYSSEALVSSGSPISGLQSYTLQIDQLCDMDAGDTAYVQVTVYGMAGNTAGFYGAATGYYTTFSGHLVC